MIVATTDTTRAAATRLLEALGNTATQVAATLHAAGIRGERCNEGACPIAAYLLRSDLGLFNVAVDGDTATLRFGHRGAYTCYVAVPDPVQDFIEQFDEGDYSELLPAGGAR